MAEACFHELLLDTNNVRPNGECLLRMRGGKRSSGRNFFSRSLCKDLCVLPDFWKFNVLKLGVAKRHDSWKLDFAKSGNLATNFLPHGAAAVVRDTNGILRFPVWGMYQLHGDLGERLGLTAKRTCGA